MFNDNKSDGSQQPGANPNSLNAKPRQSARPRTQNSSNGKSNQSMRLGWVDPLPQVDVIYPLGLEPNVESIPAGEIDLSFDLPEHIGQPFADTVESVGDRIQLTDDDKLLVSTSIRILSFFKCARQLYSTMLDHEKAANQPLKAVYYDETPIPLHMAGAIGIVGHMDTKVGKVLVKDAGLLFKRWIAAGLNHANTGRGWGVNAENLVWSDTESFKSTQRLARERLDSLTNQTYQIEKEGTTYTVSMPKLTTQTLPDYYNMINNQVPQADTLRHLVAGLQANLAHWRAGTLPHNQSRADYLQSLGLTYATGNYEIPALRDAFESWIADYITTTKWRVESIFKVGPPPAGTTGYGAQTVRSDGNSARWQFPLSDADVNIGYLFSPSKGFTLAPRMVGYSRRRADDAAAAFANADAKAFVSG